MTGGRARNPWIAAAAGVRGGLESWARRLTAAALIAWAAVGAGPATAQGAAAPGGATPATAIQGATPEASSRNTLQDDGATAPHAVVAPSPGPTAASSGAPPASATSPAAAPPVAQAPDPGANLDAVRETLTKVQSQAQGTSDDDRLNALWNASATAQAAADQLISSRSKELTRLDQQLSKAAPLDRRAEPDAVRRQRTLLIARRAELERQLKQAQGVDAAASHTYDLVAEKRRDAFSARVFRQTASPVSPAFWSSLIDATSKDSGRLASVAREMAMTALRAPEPRAGLAVAVALALALALLWPARMGLERLGRPKASGAASGGGFTLSAYALWIAVVDTLLPSLAAMALHLGAQWGGLLSDKADDFVGASVIAVTWGAAVVAIGRAIVGRGEAGRRLAPVSEDAAKGIGTFLWIVAVITGGGFLLTRINDLVGASVALTVATNCLLSLAYSAVAGSVLVRFGRRRASSQPEAPPRDAAQSSGWTLVSLTLTTAILVTLGAVFAGYTTLAVLVSGQIFWLSLLAAVTYLLIRFVDDLCVELFRDTADSQGWAARTLFALFNLRRSTIDQLGVLTAAGLQLLILIGAFSLALTPFGQSGQFLLSRFGQIGRTIHIGSAAISPAAVAEGLASLAVGLSVVHLVRGWVVRRYLPVTDWDAGVRNSVSTGVGYVGVGLTVLCALAAMGLGFKQIALVASALSVGIGFGLQQVVQNFVSGLILLIERPVKVGDWINVAGVEGDIRHIRVRATEIQTFDRTTQIVPNSDLITKTVQNKTLGDPRGRIQLQLSISNPCDAGRASSLIMDAAKARAEVLDDPAPAVFIDSLSAGGAVNFNCFCYVDSPRDVYKVRSALYFDLLAALDRSGVLLVGSQSIVVEPGPGLQAGLEALTRAAQEPPPAAAASQTPP